jgi:putative addiction module killer protein
MIKVYETINFRHWFSGIKDLSVRIRLARRLDRARLGNLGDFKKLAQFLFEMREFFGKGWRMYFYQDIEPSILMLYGGTKDSQRDDINKAKQMIKELTHDSKDS